MFLCTGAVGDFSNNIIISFCAIEEYIGCDILVSVIMYRVGCITRCVQPLVKFPNEGVK